MADIGASSHDNLCVFDCSDIASMKYIDASFLVSEGQPSYPPPQCKKINANRWHVNINCGRHKTGTVASFYISLCGGKNHMFAVTYKDKEPDELNFFFGITITFKVKWKNNGVEDFVEAIYDLYLAQGSNLTANNWWIGGECIVSPDNTYAYLPVFDPNGNLLKFYRVNPWDSGGVSLNSLI